MNMPSTVFLGESYFWMMNHANPTTVYGLLPFATWSTTGITIRFGWLYVVSTYEPSLCLTRIGHESGLRQNGVVTCWPFTTRSSSPCFVGPERSPVFDWSPSPTLTRHDCSVLLIR